VRIRNAHHVSLVLKDKNVVDVFARTQTYVLLLPHTQKILDVWSVEFGEGQVVTRAVTDDPCDPACRRVTEYPNRRLELTGRLEPDAGGIVIEDESGGIVVVPLAVDSSVAGTEVTVGLIDRNLGRFAADCLTDPRPVLAMCRDDDPFFP